MVRAFVAINLDENIRKALVSVQEMLPKSIGKFKLVEMENLHLTVKFLGEVSDDRIGAIANSIRASITGFPAFDMEVGGLGTFPSPQNPRVFWAGVRNDREVRELQRVVDHALAPLGFTRDPRFHPHITLARFKSLVDRNWLSNFLQTHSNRSFGRMRVDRVDLMQSTLTSRGPIYTKLVEIPLG
jgi:2'-5' RNA ligase